LDERRGHRTFARRICNRNAESRYNGFEKTTAISAIVDATPNGLRALLGVILVTPLLVMGVSGYRLVSRSKQLEAASGDLSDQGSRVAEVSPVGWAFAVLMSRL